MIDRTLVYRPGLTDAIRAVARKRLLTVQEQRYLAQWAARDDATRNTPPGRVLGDKEVR